MLELSAHQEGKFLFVHRIRTPKILNVKPNSDGFADHRLFAVKYQKSSSPLTTSLCRQVHHGNIEH